MYRVWSGEYDRTHHTFEIREGYAILHVESRRRVSLSNTTWPCDLDGFRWYLVFYKRSSISDCLDMTTGTERGIRSSLTFVGIDLPAVVSASFLLAVVSWKPTCVESLITPRGQIITAAFVPALWFMLGTSIRRLAQGHWHNQIGRLRRAFLALGLVALPLGVICLACSVVASFSELSLSVRLGGFAFWMIYIAALVAERLRVGPFKSLNGPVRA